ATAATTAEAAAAATAAATTATATGSLRLLDLDGASVQVGPVEPADGLLGFFRSGHLHEAEAAGTSGVSVRHDTGRFDRARSREGFAQPLVGRREREASNEQFDCHEVGSFRGRGSRQRMRDLTVGSIHWT